jgi:spore coat protein A, manganese oxidase
MSKIKWGRGFMLFWAALLSLSVSDISANQQVIQDVLDGSKVPQFVEPVPTFNGNRVDGKRPLKVSTEEFQQQILPSSFYKKLPHTVRYKSVETGETVAVINPRKGTYLWGYKICDGEKTFGPSYPINTIVAKRGVKTKVQYFNHLVPFKDKHGHSLPGPLLQKFLTVDLSVCWANPLNYPMTIQGVDTYDPINSPLGTGLPLGNPGFYAGPQPMVVHLHGGETPSYADGGPDSWFTPKKIIKGPSFVSNKYIYPNTQQATTLWFHDHVFGETRMSVYAGQAGFYFIRGNPENAVCPRLPR